MNEIEFSGDNVKSLHRMPKKISIFKNSRGGGEVSEYWNRLFSFDSYVNPSQGKKKRGRIKQRRRGSRFRVKRSGLRSRHYDSRVRPHLIPLKDRSIKEKRC